MNAQITTPNIQLSLHQHVAKLKSNRARLERQRQPSDLNELEDVVATEWENI